MDNSNTKATGITADVLGIFTASVKLINAVGKLLEDSRERNNIIKEVTQPYQEEIKQTRLVENGKNFFSIVRELWKFIGYDEQAFLTELIMRPFNPVIIDFLCKYVNIWYMVYKETEAFSNLGKNRQREMVKAFIEAIASALKQVKEITFQFLDSAQDLIADDAVANFLHPHLFKFLRKFSSDIICLHGGITDVLGRSEEQHITQLNEFRLKLRAMGIQHFKDFENIPLNMKSVNFLSDFQDFLKTGGIQRVQINYKLTDTLPFDTQTVANFKAFGVNFECGYGKTPIENLLRKGKVYIIDHQHYPVGSGYGDRETEDASKLKKLFEIWEMNVEIKTNLKLLQVKKLIQSIKDTDFSQYPSLVIVVLGHGKQEDQIVASDAYEYRLKDIYDAVATNVTLVGKVKFYIVQACRGDKDVDGRNEESVRDKGLPTDTVVLYSTAEGYKSYALGNNSIFIDKLIDRLMSHSFESVINIAQYVAAEVQKESESWRDIERRDNMKITQVPSYSGTLH